MIKYFKYPNGESGILKSDACVYSFNFEHTKTVEEDLWRLLLVLKHQRMKDAFCNLFVRFDHLPYSREDRCNENLPTLKILAALLNELNVHVLIEEPHSKEVAYNLFDKVSFFNMERAWVNYIEENFYLKDCFLIVPDLGALKKCEAIAATLDIPLVKFTKSRISKDEIKMSLIDAIPESRTQGIIVDDVCDGGGTFLLIAKTLKPFNKDLHLLVHTGFFTKGREILEQEFKTVKTFKEIKK
jgi:ribose-phosphate pyrophosphokinase